MNMRRRLIIAGVLAFAVGVVMDIVGYAHAEPLYWLSGAVCLFIASRMFYEAGRLSRR